MRLYRSNGRLTGQSLLNVKDVAAFLLTVFHEAPCKRGYYYQLHQEYPRPECWLAAIIETLVGMHQRKAVKNAGKYFYDRCVALHQTPTLPLQTQALVAQYAHLSYAQVLAALTAPKAATHAPLSSTRAGQPDQYAAFVASRLAEQRAAYLVSHPLPADAPAPQERLPLPVAGGSQPDQYAAFVARRLAEQRAAWSKGV